jgi:hypothetical protein
MALIFNSITQFQRQPERTKTRVKRNELDTLSEIWVGPSWAEDSFIPAFGTVHQDYNLMNLNNSSVRRLPGSVSEVTLTYQGKLANGSSTGYTSVPTISRSWMEGEVSYQVNHDVTFNLPVIGTGGYGSVSQFGVATYSRRYSGRCVEIAYLTNRIPTGDATMLGAAKGFLGFLNVSDTFSGFSAGMKLSGGSGGPFEQMVCTDVKVADQANGWYQVTETYQSRMFPGDPGIPLPTITPGAPPPPPSGGAAQGVSIRAPSRPADNTDAATGSGISTNTLGATEAQIMGFTYNPSGPIAHQAAQGAANSYGAILPPPSDPITNPAGQQVSWETGIDPAYGDIGGLLQDYAMGVSADTILAAADSANSASGNLQTSYESTFLDY